MKRMIFLLLALVATTAAPAHSAILVFSPNGTYTTKLNLAAASTAADAAGKKIVVTSPYTISSVISWPADRKLEIEKGGLLTFSGSGALNLAANASFSAGAYQVFAGTYAVTGLPDSRSEWFGAGYNNWQLARAAAVKPPTTHIYNSKTYGTYETAVASSITANSGSGQAKENTQVLGTNAQGLASAYTDRDHVAQYLSSSSFVPHILNSTTTYTSSTLTNSAVSGLDIKPGMIVDTQHADICTGVVQSVSGNTVTVGTWYNRSAAAVVTPANGTGAIINPNNKIFGQNIVVSAQGNGTTTGSAKFSGIEMDLITPTSGSPINGTWGIDMVSIGGSYVDIGYQMRGKRNYSFFSNNVGGAGLYGFRSEGDGRGLSVNDASTMAIEVVTGGAAKFYVAPNGVTTGDSFVSGYTTQKGGGGSQCTTAWVDIGSPPANGSLLWVTGFNVSGGSEGSFLLMVRSGTVVTVSASDGTGLGITFQAVGRQLQIKTTSGTFQFYYHQVSA